MLQTQDLKISQANESYIGVNIRELNKELCINLFTLYN